MEAKKPSDSRITVSRLMGPQDANNLGNVHGGIVMKMVDEAGALAAMRHARGPVVTVRIDSMNFRKPVFTGQLVTIHAELTYAGRTSMEARVEVLAESPFETGDATFTNLAYVVYVAIDEDGQPRPVPPLVAEDETQMRRMEQAKERQAFRKQQQQAEKELEELNKGKN